MNAGRRLLVRMALAGALAGAISCSTWSLAVSSTISNIPTDTRIQTYVDELSRRGLLRGFFFSDRPYSREKVCDAVAALEASITAGKVRLSPYETWLLDRLREEFYVIRQNASADGIVETGAELGVTGRASSSELTGTVDLAEGGREVTAEESDESVRGIGSGWVEVSTRYGVSLSHRFRVDSKIEEDPSFLGRPWRAETGGYVANGYLKAVKGPLEVLFGRDKLSWGPGSSGSLILSDAAAPFDMVNVTLDFGVVRATGFFTSLDDFRLLSALPFQGDTLQAGEVARRHLSGHRIDVRVLRTLEIGLSETVMYGGPDRELDLGYINPLNFFYAQQWNSGENDNPIWSLDVCWWPRERLQAYGQLVVDDLQFENKGEKDREPAEIGFLLGLHSGDPFGLDGVSLTAEYVRVNPWTYNQPLPWNRYKYGSALLGHPIGPDSDALMLRVGKWFNEYFSADLDYAFTRHGETSVDSDWPVPLLGPWGDAAFPKGFPLGVVAKSHKLGLTARFHPRLHLDVEGTASVEKVYDYENFDGLDSLQLAFGLSLSFRPEWAFLMRQ